jgi:hypothetical protein
MTKYTFIKDAIKPYRSHALMMLLGFNELIIGNSLNNNLNPLYSGTIITTPEATQTNKYYASKSISLMGLATMVGAALALGSAINEPNLETKVKEAKSETNKHVNFYR